MRIGIDIGGTFTDLVRYDPERGTIETSKRPSTPGDPAEAVLAGLAGRVGRAGRAGQAGGRDAAGGSRLDEIVHGSTVATNALLERKGAATALITTRGFRDVLEIGRQDRPALYDLLGELPAPLVPRPWRFEVDERVDAHGRVLHALDPHEVANLIPVLQAEGIRSVAVSLLFSFLHPGHEETIARLVREAGLSASASCEILPEFREYERTSTTVVNAYVSPVMEGYLARMADALGGTSCGSCNRTAGASRLEWRGGTQCAASCRGRQEVWSVLRRPVKRPEWGG